MMHSLQSRLLIVIVSVSLLAVGAVALLSSRATSVEFQKYVANDKEVSLERFRSELLAHYEQHKSWKDVVPLLDRISNLSGKSLILTDTNQNILAAAPETVREAEIKITPDHRMFWNRQQMEAGKIQVQQFAFVRVPHIDLNDATLYLAPIPLQQVKENEETFIGSVNRSLILAGLGSASIALIIGLILARRILKPVEALTAAAKEMGSGNLKQRVQVDGRDELSELAQTFNAMADALARTEELRRNLVSDVAHELRTPLASIRCQLEAMQDGLAEPGREVINSIHEETLQLTRLVEDLQDLALAEAGQLRLELEQISIEEKVSQAIKTLVPLARERNVQITTSIPDELPHVTADPNRIRQVITNILSNSISHTSSEGRITITAEQKGNEVRLQFSDTGEGIAPEHLPHIFDRFYRTDHSRSRTTGGSGLGLAIVRQLIELHQGSIAAESKLGQGTTIYISLPAARNKGDA